MDGILLVDKLSGWTSHDVVAKVRGIIRAETGQRVKVGHTGTLDPFATGLLVLVLGSYTKRAGQFSKLDKVYETEITLGATSATGDPEGQITPYRVRPDEAPGLAEIGAVLSGFLGEIEQTPPAYSAVKVGGQRAYKLARAGKEVKIGPRKVKIYEITDIKFDYPKLKFTCKVSSGTYIRSLAADIGAKLDAGAYLSALRRTQVGDFKIERALRIEDLTPENVQKSLRPV